MVTIRIDLKPRRSLTISVELPAFTGGGGLCFGGPLIGRKGKSNVVIDLRFVKTSDSPLCFKRWTTLAAERLKDRNEILTAEDVPLCRSSVNVVFAKNPAISWRKKYI